MRCSELLERIKKQKIFRSCNHLLVSIICEKWVQFVVGGNCSITNIIMLQCSLEVVSQKDEQVVTKMPSGFAIPVNEGGGGGFKRMRK